MCDKQTFIPFTLKNCIPVRLNNHGFCLQYWGLKLYVIKSSQNKAMHWISTYFRMYVSSGITYRNVWLRFVSTILKVNCTGNGNKQQWIMPLKLDVLHNLNRCPYLIIFQTHLDGSVIDIPGRLSIRSKSNHIISNLINPHPASYQTRSTWMVAKILLSVYRYHFECYLSK